MQRYKAIMLCIKLSGNYVFCFLPILSILRIWSIEYSNVIMEGGTNFDGCPLSFDTNNLKEYRQFGVTLRNVVARVEFRDRYLNPRS